MQVIHVHFHKPGKLIPVGYSVYISVWDYHNIDTKNVNNDVMDFPKISVHILNIQNEHLSVGKMNLKLITRSPRGNVPEFGC